MPKTLLLAVAFVVLVIVLFVADRAIKAYIQSRRRRAMEGRLASAQAKGEAKVEQQRQAAAAREALTSVMPGIHAHKPRHVNEPSLPSSSNSGPHDRRVA
jgi:Tfp pilus assembly protein PilE